MVVVEIDMVSSCRDRYVVFGRTIFCSGMWFILFLISAESS